MEQIWRYCPESGFTNKNAGFSMWCFGTWRGEDYFIKQFLSPKFPVNDTESSPEKIERKIDECLKFERKRSRLYDTLNACSDGNDVRVEEFFRVDSRYYIATKKVEALPWTIETIAAMPLPEKKRLCAIIAHSIGAIHRGRLVHSDIKHDNILFTRTECGVTAKVIDFDGGFLEDEAPTMDEGVTGDTNYFSPEVCARSYGEERPLTCKLDVFALGVLFHQYFTGEMPAFDQEAFSCPGEAVLNGARLGLSGELPPDLSRLLERMLAGDPGERPTALEVSRRLRTKEPDVADLILEQTGRLRVPERGAAFCARCRRPIRGTDSLCPDCAAELRGTAVGKGSAFYQPGDL